MLPVRRAFCRNLRISEVLNPLAAQTESQCFEIFSIFFRNFAQPFPEK
jgi:hypothetical protein